MKLRALALTLACVTVSQGAPAADDFCNRLIVQALSQFCRLLPNGSRLCQPVALVGNAAECATPTPPAIVPVGPPSLLPAWAAPTWPSPVAGSANPLQNPLQYPRPIMTPLTQAAPTVVSAPLAAMNPPAVVSVAKPEIITVPAPTELPPTTKVPDANPPLAVAAAARPMQAEMPAISPTISPAMLSVATPEKIFEPAPTALPTTTKAPETNPPLAVAAAARTMPAEMPTIPPATSPTISPTISPAVMSVATPESITASPPVQGASLVAAIAAPSAPAAAAPGTAIAPAQAPQVHPQTAAMGKEGAVNALAHFDFDSDQLTAAGRAVLDAWRDEVSGSNSVRVSGFTDRLGSEIYNLKLSQRRAEAVKRYLVAKGMDAHRIQTEALGKSKPVKRCKGSATPSTKACLAPNRRAVIDPQ